MAFSSNIARCTFRFFSGTMAFLVGFLPDIPLVQPGHNSEELRQCRTIAFFCNILLYFFLFVTNWKLRLQPPPPYFFSFFPRIYFHAALRPVQVQKTSPRAGTALNVLLNPSFILPLFGCTSYFTSDRSARPNANSAPPMLRSVTSLRLSIRLRCTHQAQPSHVRSARLRFGIPGASSRPPCSAVRHSTLIPTPEPGLAPSTPELPGFPAPGVAPLLVPEDGESEFELDSEVGRG